MRQLLTTLAEIAGATIIVGALFTITTVAGVIGAGVALIAAGVLLA